MAPPMIINIMGQHDRTVASQWLTGTTIFLKAKVGMMNDSPQRKCDMMKMMEPIFLHINSHNGSLRFRFLPHGLLSSCRRHRVAMHRRVPGARRHRRPWQSASRKRPGGAPTRRGPWGGPWPWGREDGIRMENEEEDEKTGVRKVLVENLMQLKLIIC